MIKCDSRNKLIEKSNRDVIINTKKRRKKAIKRYQVECKVDNRDQYEGREPHSDIRIDCVGDFIKAETPEEAIEFAKDYITDNVDNWGKDERGDIITYDDDKNIDKCYYNFTATEKIKKNKHENIYI